MVLTSLLTLFEESALWSGGEMICINISLVLASSARETEEIKGSEVENVERRISHCNSLNTSNNK